MRRAMSCVYWAPKSRIRTRSAWMSAAAIAPSLPTVVTGSTGRSASGDAVIGRFLGDRDIVHVALAHARVGHAHEGRARAHLLDVVAAGIAHGGAQAAGQLRQDRDQAALVRHAPLDALRHELLELGRRVLKIAVRRPVALGHGA